ncbi:MAG: hypothetical protein ABFS16_16580, partial [Bacteroidota bacterium]
NAMGYNGLGMQRWIYTMKPRKFLGKRSKPDGEGADPAQTREIGDYYHLNKNKLENLQKRKYTGKYKRLLHKQLEVETRKQKLYSILSSIIILTAFILFIFYLNSKLEWF